MTPAPVAICLPHARGGVSTIYCTICSICMSSPRPWGCFQGIGKSVYHEPVFPTPVGVFLRCAFTLSAQYRLPHARGGVSLSVSPYSTVLESSPRPWGCFQLTIEKTCLYMVFPTPVGVFPSILLPLELQYSLPHARGGVSIDLINSACNRLSSPRPWGCFYRQRRLR